MASFSEKSKKELLTCHPKLQEVLNEVIKYFDFTVICGHRGEEAQNEAFRNGLSRKKFPNSKHNSMPSMAVDIAPYPVTWENVEEFYFLAGIVIAFGIMKGIKIIFGGNWDGDNDMHDQTFMDLGHYQLEEE